MWTGFVVLLAALVLAAVGGLIVDIPALLAGVKISSGHTPPGISSPDTIVQDVAFVLTAVMFAQFGGTEGALLAVRIASHSGAARRGARCARRSSSF